MRADATRQRHASPARSSAALQTTAGAYSAGLITEEQRQDIVHNACPGAGACGGMYTANTVCPKRQGPAELEAQFL